MAAPLQWHTQIIVAAPHRHVWAIADDITLIPQYHPEVRHVELISGAAIRAAGVRYRCTIPEGRKGSCIEEITEYVPGSRFVTAFPEDSWGLSKQLADFNVETVVEPVPEGTRIRLNAYYRPRTLFMKLFNRLGLRGMMARRAFRMLAGVKRLAEQPAA
jgi:polyketide cyclase/dehydrase/lipid transport protein